MKNFLQLKSPPALLSAALILFFAVGARGETTIVLSDAEIHGRQLALQLCDAQPITNFTQNGTLKIRDAKGVTTNIPVHFETQIRTGEWQANYLAETNDISTASPCEDLSIAHKKGQDNQYQYFVIHGDHQETTPPQVLTKNQIMASFAGSDFGLADLGLEFFHWPAQKILKHEIRRSRGCAVLESTNPDPATNGYSRVVSWIDSETLGIIHAEAYDAQNKLLKEFDPKSFKKVNGQWELQEMEIRNVQAGSRTRLEFDLNSKL